MTESGNLIQEIAEILNCSVNELQSRPHEMLDILEKTYINYWHSDLTELMQKPDIPEKSHQIAHISREMQRQFAEELHRNQAYEHEKQLERSVTDARERKQSNF